MHLGGKLCPSYFPSSPFSPQTKQWKIDFFVFIFSFPLFHFLPFHPNQTPLHLLYVVKQSIRFIMCSCICLFLIVIIRSSQKKKNSDYKVYSEVKIMAICWTLEHRLFWFHCVTVIMLQDIGHKIQVLH